jgi:hypothetical protein
MSWFCGERPNGQVVGLVVGCERAADLLPYRAEVGGGGGAGFGLSENAGQVCDYPAGVDSVEDVRQSVAESGAAAAEYITGSPELRMLGPDFA